MWKYCEICNKNFQSSQIENTQCPTCGWISISHSIDKYEKERRDKIYKGFCNKCGEIRHSVPIQIALSVVDCNRSINTQNIQNTSNSVYTVRDRRYKSGYRLTSNGETACCLCCIFLVATLVTYGIALIPIGIYYYYQYRKKQDRIDGTHQQFNQIQQYLYQQSQLSPYVCSKCFNAIQLLNDQIQEPKIKQIEVSKSVLLNSTPVTKVCEFCGNTNLEFSSFCADCGSNLGHVSSVNDKTANRHIPSDIRNEVWKRDGGCCVRCHTTKALQYDHIIPFSKGGASTVENLQLLCANCNTEKRDKIDG